MSNEEKKMFEEVDIMLKCLQNKIDAYEETYNKGLEDGRNEVWELIKKINKAFDEHKLDVIFDKRKYSIPNNIIDDYTPQEALLKLEEYEKAQNEIKVGDVVIAVSIESVVTKVGEDFVHTIDKNGSSGKYAKFVCKKTGKHIDIQSVLQQIGE